MLEVLDRPKQKQFTLAEMELLRHFANQAAIALDLLQGAGRADGRIEDEGGAEADALARFAARLEARPSRRSARRRRCSSWTRWEKLLSEER